MPITLSIMPAINAAITAQNATLTTAINAARDNVNAATVTQLNTQTTALNTTVNAARDNVNAATVTQLNAQTTAINNNVDTDFAAVAAAVNAKGVVKSVQRGTTNFASASSVAIAIAAVDPAKSMLIVNGFSSAVASLEVSGFINSGTQITVQNWSSGGSIVAHWQVVEYF